MELRQLVYLDAVVRFGGFTRAAEHLHVAQPAVSAQIRRLERELGATLLRRSTRSVALTDVGADFLRHVRDVLSDLDAARAVVEDHRSVRAGRLIVGSTPITGGFDLASALRVFRDDHPGVSLALRTDLIDPLLEALRRESVHLVIGPAPVASQQEAPEGLLMVPLADESLVLITATSDARTITSAAQVVGDDFTCLGPTSGLRRLLDVMFQPLGRQPRVEFEAQSPAGIRQLVAAGLGTALIARSAATDPGPPVKIHHCQGIPSHPPICAFTPARPTAAARSFLAALPARSAAG